MTKFLRGAIGALVLGTAMACSELGGPDGTLGSIVATIDGDLWTANQGKEAAFANGTLELAGLGTAGGTRYLLTLTIGGVTGPGTYQLGPQFPGSFGTLNTTAIPAIYWNTAEAGGSGTLTITNLAGDLIQGTFSFTAISTTETGPNATRTVTSGSFELRF